MEGEDALLAELLNAPAADPPGGSPLEWSVTDPLLEAMEAEHRALEQKLRDYDAKYGSPLARAPDSAAKSPGGYGLEPQFMSLFDAPPGEGQAEPLEEALPAFDLGALRAELHGAMEAEGAEGFGLEGVSFQSEPGGVAARRDVAMQPKAGRKSRLAKGRGGRQELLAHCRRLRGEKDRLALRLTGQAKAIQAITGRLQARQGELDALRVDNERLQAGLKRSRADCVLLQSQKEAAMREVSAGRADVDKQLQAFVDEIEGLKKRLKQLSERESSAAQRNSQLLQRLREAQAARDAAVREKGAEQARVADIAKGVERAQAMLKRAQVRLKAEMGNVKKLRGDLEEKDGEIREKDAEVARAKAKAAQALEQAAAARREAARKEEERLKAEELRSRAESSLRELASELQVLKASEAVAIREKRAAARANRARKEPQAVQESVASATKPATKKKKPAAAGKDAQRPAKGRPVAKAPPKATRRPPPQPDYDSDSSSDLSWDGIYAESAAAPVRRRQQLREAKNEYTRIMATNSPR
mmetsp:Transcript_17174/g.48349  ORF Transcript_17174/g.48349 Transcript_17174/m.48349 type:complete len:530 (+) Transcript_17174:30-1619(+)